MGTGDRRKHPADTLKKDLCPSAGRRSVELISDQIIYHLSCLQNISGETETGSARQRSQMRDKFQNKSISPPPVLALLSSPPSSGLPSSPAHLPPSSAPPFLPSVIFLLFLSQTHPVLFSPSEPPVFSLVPGLLLLLFFIVCFVFLTKPIKRWGGGAEEASLFMPLLFISATFPAHSNVTAALSLSSSPPSSPSRPPAYTDFSN